MSTKANVKLSITFNFDLVLPDAMVDADHGALCRRLNELLGPMVLQGMPTVTAKRLAQVGGSIVAHHHHLDASSLAVPALAQELLVAAAPHLTDDELVQLARRAASRLPAGEDERRAFLRRQALAMVNEYRTIPCIVTAKLTSGAVAELEGKLNLTNGNVLIGERDRQQRLQPKQGPVEVTAAEGDARMSAEFAGQTLSGPVIDVPVADLARCRDVLIAVWQMDNRA